MSARTADHGSHRTDGNRTDPAPPHPLLHEATTGAILGAFYAVYRQLGSGFLEAVYGRALAIELLERGLTAAAEVPVSVTYRGRNIGVFYADQIVNDVVLIELKAAERITGTHEQQLINYLSATRLEVGLLLNFGPRATFKRFIHTNNNKQV